MSASSHSGPSLRTESAVAFPPLCTWQPAPFVGAATMAFVEHDSAAELGVDSVICRLPSAQACRRVARVATPLQGDRANRWRRREQRDVKVVPDAVVVAPVVTPEASTFVQLLTSPVGCRPDTGVGVGERAGIPVPPAAHAVCPDVTVAPIGQMGVCRADRWRIRVGVGL